MHNVFYALFVKFKKSKDIYTLIKCCTNTIAFALLE